MDKNNKNTTKNSNKILSKQDVLKVATQIIAKHVNAFKELAK